MVEKSNVIMDKTFKHDQNYHRGWIYGWDMEPLCEVDFKFQKIKSRSAEGKEVEYYVQFMSGFNPEHEFKDLYYRKDGRERFGFYIDVEDKTKNIVEKWLIVNKDSRVAFDRYNVFKCNWALEWIYEDEYHTALGCVRDAADTTFGSDNNISKLGGSMVNGEIDIILPVTPETRTILLGQRFIISDNTLNPQTYMIVKIKDSSPLGIMRCSCKQRLYNPHTDYYGIINNEKSIDFKFDLPIDDLPSGFGGEYHAICDCIKTRGLPEIELEEGVTYSLKPSSTKLVIKGNPVLINMYSSADEPQVEWHYLIDNEEYSRGEIEDYFEIEESDSYISIRAIHEIMNKYIFAVYVTDGVNSSEIVEMEVGY